MVADLSLGLIYHLKRISHTHFGRNVPLNEILKKLSKNMIFHDPDPNVLKSRIRNRTKIIGIRITGRHRLTS
jgi:hypothetical protein